MPTVSASGTVYVCIVMEWCQMDLHRYVLVRGGGARLSRVDYGHVASPLAASQHQRRVQAGPIPEERLIRWAAHLLSALKYCHAKGVCHRDIKSGEEGGCGRDAKGVCLGDIKLGAEGHQIG